MKRKSYNFLIVVGSFISSICIGFLIPFPFGMLVGFFNAIMWGGIYLILNSIMKG